MCVVLVEECGLVTLESGICVADSSVAVSIADSIADKDVDLLLLSPICLAIAVLAGVNSSSWH